MGEEEYPESEKDFLDRLHSQVSRTFDLALKHLDTGEGPGKHLRDIIQTGYLMCRSPDTIEDDSYLDRDDKAYLLDLYEKALNGEEYFGRFVREAVDKGPYSRDQLENMTGRLEENDTDVDADWLTVYNTTRIIDRFEHLDENYGDAASGEDVEGLDSVRKPVIEMTAGMKSLFSEDEPAPGGIEYDNGVRVLSGNGLENYCDIVAGTVGSLLTDTFSEVIGLDEETRNNLENTQEDFAYFLQFLNALKDVYSDYHEEGAIYIPESILSKHGRSHSELGDLLEKSEATRGNVEELLEGEDLESEITAIDELAGKTAEKSEGAFEYIEAISGHSGEVTRYLMTPFLLGQATLREIQDRTDETFEPGDIKASKAETMSIFHVVEEKFPEEIGLEEINQEIQAQPLHLVKNG